MSLYRVDPRVRACGKARIDITRRAKDEQEWQRLWKDPRYPFPFTWGNSWKNAFQYQVDDYAAEVGFLMDVLGLPVLAFSPSSAIFTSPDQEFALSVVDTPEGCQSTPPDTLRIQFVVKDLFRTVEELERRGIVFEQRPQEPPAPEFGLLTGYFRTPHGICIDLIAAAEPEEAQLSGEVQPAEFELEVESREEILDPAPDEQQPLEVEPEDDPFAFLNQDSQPDDEPPASDQDPFTFEFSGSSPAVSDEDLKEDLLEEELLKEEPLEEESSAEGPLEQESLEQGPLAQGPLAQGPSQLFFEEYKPGDRQPPAGQEDLPGTSETRDESPRQGNSRSAEGPRRGDPFPRTNSLRRSSLVRGNGELRRSDRTRRSGGSLRKNPFSHADLPPLPDFIDHRLSSPPRENIPGQAADDRSSAPARFDPPDGEAPDETETKSQPSQSQEAEIEEQIKYEDIEEVENPGDFDEFFT